MYILAIETTGKYPSASVISQCGTHGLVASRREMSHLSEIISIVDQCIRDAGITKEDLTHVAASVGPGSFTGIRIGVTTARTLGQMLEIPCISVSTLEAMTVDTSISTSFRTAPRRYIVPIINARRRQTYAGIWEVLRFDGYSELVPVLPEKQYMIEELCEYIKELDGDALFTGDGIDAYAKNIAEILGPVSAPEMAGEGKYAFTCGEERYQSARGVGLVALPKAANGKVLSYDELLPNYMRKSEAEMRLEAGTLSDKIHE